jgi:hypothetical protein
MLRVGFEPAIPMFEWPKTVLALDSAAIEIGPFLVLGTLFILVFHIFDAYKVKLTFKIFFTDTINKNNSRKIIIGKTYPILYTTESYLRQKSSGLENVRIRISKLFQSYKPFSSI